MAAISSPPLQNRWSGALADFLHSGGRRGNLWQHLPRASPLLVIIGCGGMYGAVMAAYHGIAGERLLMILFGAAKVPMLFLVTMLLAVPAFYVLNLLLGAGDDFQEVWSGLVDYQMAVAIQLLALAPVTAFMNLTNGDYRTAQAWSTLLFAVAAWNARRSLSARYRGLIARHPSHRWLQHAWFAVYSFIGIQMAWDLRPFVGHPTMPVQFFRDDIGNAYVEVAKLAQMFFKETF